MAVTRVSKAKDDGTLVIELSKAKSYTHYGYGMTFIGGAQYTFSREDAQELLGLSDEWGVPYFRIYREPEPEPTVEERVAQQGVQSLPKGNDLTSSDLEGGTKKPAKKAPKPVKVTAPDPEPAPPTDDEGEIDTAGGVEV